MHSIFGNWFEFVNKSEFLRITTELHHQLDKICPNPNDVFRIFKILAPEDCKVVFLGQDPYPQKGIATGILFGNKSDTPEKDYSPSLKVIRNSLKDLENPDFNYTFDPTLEYWVKQGVLMINSAFTVEQGKIGSHTMLWRRFTATFINNLSKYNNDLIFVLFGTVAQTFSPYIFGGEVIKSIHPAYYARSNTPMPSEIFNRVNEYLEKYNKHIEWCKPLI